MGSHEVARFFCCKELKFHAEEREKIIIYIPQTRSYMIKVNNHIGQEIIYCPWCGVKFPEDLTNLRANIIFEELCLDGYDDSRLPEEFRTDEWWKKRGL